MRKSKLVDALGFAIDESNHGRSPEFLVAVCSSYATDLQLYEERKKTRVGGTKSGRRIREEDFLGMLFSRDFRYTKVSKRDINRYGKDLIVNAAGKLIHSFGQEARGRPIAVYIDGNLTIGRTIALSAEVAKILKTHPSAVGIHPMPKTKDEKTKLYQSVPLLRMADTAANYIFRKHNRNEELDSRFKEKEVKF